MKIQVLIMNKVKIILTLALFSIGVILVANQYVPVKPEVKKVSAVKKRIKINPKARSKKITLQTKKTDSYFLYFPSGHKLKAEVREGKFEPKKSISELIKGPVEKSNASYLPKNTKMISMSINKDIATINFSKEILNAPNAGAEAESLTLYSITNTLTQTGVIKKVIIQVEGRVEGEIGQYIIEDFWGHVGLYDQPFRENKSINRKE